MAFYISIDFFLANIRQHNFYGLIIKNNKLVSYLHINQAFTLKNQYLFIQFATSFN